MPRHLGVFARGEVDDLHADRALDRLNDVKVARGQEREERAVLQMWGLTKDEFGSLVEGWV